MICLLSCNKESLKLDKHNLNNYFIIKGVETEFEDRVFKNIYPEIINHFDDSLGVFMNKYSRRFEYILTNRTDHIFKDSIFQDLFPDTVRMSRIYNQRIGEDKLLLKYLNSFANPNNVASDKIVYTNPELMAVASKFFLCDRVNPDTTINWHVCIGLNGQQQAGWEKDYTLLEAFSFEAIFDGLRSQDESKTQFMFKFLEFVKQAEEDYKDLPFEMILENSRDDVFRKMELNSELKGLLIQYYEERKTQLPFEIQ